MKLKTSYLFYNLLIIKTMFILHYFIDLNKLKPTQLNKSIVVFTKKDDYFYRNNWILYYLFFISFYCFMRTQYLKF